MKVKKLIVLVTSIVLIIGVGGAALGYTSNSMQDETVVAQINGIPLEAREFKLVRQELRSTTPPEKLQEQTLQMLAAIKVEQSWAKEKGLVDDLSYRQVLKRWNAENARRKQAVQEKKPIYGPMQYDERGFYEYELSNLRIRLKEALSKDEFKLSEEALKQKYEEIKEQQFKKPDAIRIQKIAISDQGGQGKSQMAPVMDKLAKGESFAELARNLAGEGGGWELTLDASNQKQASEAAPILLEHALKLSQGQQSPVFEENGATFVIKCVQRTDNGFEPFDQVKRLVQSFYVEESYRQEMERKLQSAATEVVKALIPE
ncbi:hypothetical protein GCM10008018_50760 [Paenibacillus marchantiophytorum]|uniref:PpiC domain-containing protein n=1 Tax=Paenibacillus marchantiophytorum TaxID=1619310 RepID=A0ABQ1F4C6_9BACL|nr:peptidyl-prolyl cis-trans isomerase [Paenibacillus marchantiophytorum]GFZ98354.1 hypothetical protein GCM10008018_50760 [Paenibacillus marchantiophytorum]